MRIVFTALALAILVASAGSISSAQTPGEDPVAACRAAHGDNADSRIACLEVAIQRMRGEVVEAQQQVQQAQQQAQQAQEHASAIEQGRPGWSLPGFRAAQRQAEPEAVTVQLVRIRYGRDGFGFFTTADGQVWRETVASPSRHHLDPERTYNAVIDRGFMGGFRMNVDGVRWEFKVEPLN